MDITVLHSTHCTLSMIWFIMSFPHSLHSRLFILLLYLNWFVRKMGYINFIHKTCPLLYHCISQKSLEMGLTIMYYNNLVQWMIRSYQRPRCWCCPTSSHLVAVHQLRLVPGVLCWRIEAGHSSDQPSLTSTQPLQPNLHLDSAPTLCVIYSNSDDSNDTEHKKIHNPFPNHQKVES